MARACSSRFLFGTHLPLTEPQEPESLLLSTADRRLKAGED